MLSKVRKPSIPYCVVKFRACSIIKLSVATKLYFEKSFSKSVNVSLASDSVISFVLTFFQIVEVNSTFEISERKMWIILTFVKIASSSSVPSSW